MAGKKVCVSGGTGFFSSSFLFFQHMVLFIIGGLRPLEIWKMSEKKRGFGVDVDALVQLCLLLFLSVVFSCCGLFSPFLF